MSMSNSHQLYLRKIRREKHLVLFMQLFIFLFIVGSWQLLVNFKLVDSFIVSSPELILRSLVGLIKSGDIFIHIGITLLEIVVSFICGGAIGFVIATLLWWFPITAKILDPYLTIFNSLPKVALGPILIIWFGSGMQSIVIMALLISTIITVINLYEGFKKTDPLKLNLMKSFKASRFDVFRLLLIPGSRNTIISTVKVSISMTLIGVIMGEFLVSKNGVGYLIMYGSQVFNLNLVMTGIIILGFLSTILYLILTFFERKLKTPF